MISGRAAGPDRRVAAPRTLPGAEFLDFAVTNVVFGREPDRIPAPRLDGRD